VLQGERERASDNKSLGRFDLTDIPRAPRGIPQIEVTFDIDANGILNVSAKDVKTGKEQRIVIKASSGLSEAEIKRMVADAEAHAEEDKKFHELVVARNKADATVHTVEKAIADAGDKVSDDEKKAATDAIAALKTAMSNDDREDIERKTQALEAASGALMQKMYERQSAGAQGSSGASGGEKGGKQEDVVDAEFEEVKDDRKKA
jgi:molecular chaperone DnaK